MGVLPSSESTDAISVSDPNKGYFNRQQQRNKKKKLKKKASKQRKRLGEKNNSELINGTSTQHKDNDSNEASDEELFTFELKGPFERFKLHLDGEETGADGEALPASGPGPSPASHTNVSLKARTAALLLEEANARTTNSARPHTGEETGRGSARTGGAPMKADSETGCSTPAPSKKRLRLLNRPSIAALKQTVQRPDVVEMWDVCARDPLLLVYLKSYRNTVAVPKHWCAKRKYLQGKRGFEKPPFKLPEFIARTGIMEMRQAVTEKDTDKSLKTKMREKIRPKVGKVDIDYHKLHDAFFRYQTRPRMTQHGDLYYEGKEFELKLKEKKPGMMSDELRNALGLPTGPNADRFPPPWLIAMQRYGPPPSYPKIKIPGLNAAIPSGSAFGYHPGGWGKPPVDELGRPIYGDVFGNGGNIAGVPPPPPSLQPQEAEDDLPGVGKQGFWGELESDDESEGEEAEDEDEDDDDDEEEDGSDTARADEEDPSTVKGEKTVLDMSGLVSLTSGLLTPSGLSSVGPGLETPDVSIELRKKAIEEAMESSTGLVTPTSGLAAGQLYRVLPERPTNVQPGVMMGSTKLYDVTGTTSATLGIEAEDQREKMLRKRPAPPETQQNAKSGTVSHSGTASGTASASAGPSVPKKYKDFKF